MKRFLFVVALIALCASVFAQITPYGSARMGYWYDFRNEDHAPHGESQLSMHYALQSNSRLGVNYRHENFDGRIEMALGGSPFSLRLLYGRQDFGTWSLLVGQDVIQGTHFQPNQVYNHRPNGELTLIDYGLAWGGRHPQVRFEMNNGFWAALITPHTSLAPQDAEGYSSAVDALFPRINLGYKINLDNILITPAAVFQYYSYDKDVVTDGGSVMSWIGAVTGEMNFEPILLNAQFNIGSNIANMGYQNRRFDKNRDHYTLGAIWDAENNETKDVMTFGGVLAATFVASPTLNFTIGGGYTASTMEDWDNPDDQMSIYLQSQVRASRLRIVPEIGILNEMSSHADVDRGMLMYFGTQLRFDF